MKNKNLSELTEQSPSKKQKLEKKRTDVSETKPKQSLKKISKYSKENKTDVPTTLKKAKPKTFPKSGKGKVGNAAKPGQLSEKPEDWNEFKKQKKELKLKRKQIKAKDGFDILIKAKKIGEELRKKSLKGGEEKRSQLTNELHSMLRGKGHYAKFVLAHDTARLVQWLLKYGSDIIVQQIAKELIPVTTEMLQSKYGIFCVKRLLKYSGNDIRSQVIDAMLGNAVKLASHGLSAPVLEYAYSTWATPLQKLYLVQEFFGDLYKKSKDAKIKHLKDTYKDDNSLKAATLGATKANLVRILNKSLLDSGLVQTVLSQYLTECSDEDKKELIGQLASHIVVISNSKDGSRVAMQCIWHGTNKDRKVIMKALKEHILELSKHEHGHCTVITLLDSVDDTVLLHKLILSEILKNAKDLAVNEWGRKVLLWLVAPSDTTKFHPVFVNELNKGRESSSSKKPTEARRKEILDYSISTLLNLIVDDTLFWLSTPSLATEMAAIVKAGSGEILEEAYNKIVEIISDVEWKIKEKEESILGIEHAGMHMTLKKLIQHDKVNLEKGNKTFGEALLKKFSNDLLSQWLKLNRGCFLVVTIFENGSEETQKFLKEKLKKHLKLLKSQNSVGAKILLKKVS